MPKTRKYLPRFLTERERRNPKLRAKLSSCIRQVEKTACPKSAKKRGKYIYKLCAVNPIATCRASLSKR